MIEDRIDNDEVEQYQDKLNAETDDGSGCAETWETLGEIRNSSGRRGVLRGIAAAGITAIGMTGSSAAATGDDSVGTVPESTVESVLSSGLVERVLEETGVEEVDRESVVKSNPDDNTSTVVYSFSTPAGMLFYGERESQVEAGISFGHSQEGGFDSLSAESKSELDGTFQSLPNSYATYTVTESESRQRRAVQSRHLTDTEGAVVIDKLGLDADRVVGVISSDRDDIVIFDPNGGKQFLTGVPDDAPYKELTATELDGLTEEVRFTTAGNCNDMLGKCAASVGAPTACIAGCVTAGVSTFGAAFALCAICTAGTSFNAGIQCAQWWEQCVK